MKDATAHRIVDAAQGETALTGSAAQAVVRAWLEAMALERDSYGNYKLSPTERYHFSKQNLQRQVKIQGRWSNVRSQPYRDAATTLLRKAAAATGRADEVVRLLGSAEKRKKTLARAAEKRITQAERAKEIAKAAIAVDMASPGLAYQAFALQDDEARQTWEQKVYREADWRTETEAPDPRPTVDRPPLHLLDLAGTVEWVESEGGADYTVWLDHGAAGQMVVTFGSTGGRLPLGVDPASRAITTRGPRAPVGDGYVSGRIMRTRGGLSAAMFLIMAIDKRLGAGRRLLGLWCRLLAGARVERWLAEAIGDEGERWLEAMAREDLLEIQHRRGRTWVVACSYGQRRLPGVTHG